MTCGLWMNVQYICKITGRNHIHHIRSSAVVQICSTHIFTHTHNSVSAHSKTSNSFTTSSVSSVWRFQTWFSNFMSVIVSVTSVWTRMQECQLHHITVTTVTTSRLYPLHRIRTLVGQPMVGSTPRWSIKSSSPRTPLDLGIAPGTVILLS